MVEEEVVKLAKGEWPWKSKTDEKDYSCPHPGGGCRAKVSPAELDALGPNA